MKARAAAVLRHRLVVPAAAYLALALAWTSPAWQFRPPHLVGGPQPTDAALQAWQLAWVSHAIVSWTNPFYTHLIYAPGGVNLLWPEPPYPLGVLFAPLSTLLGPIASYNTAIAAVLFLNCVAGYWACRRWTPHLGAAMVGGLLFGFSPYVTGQVDNGHLDLSAAFLVPVMLVLLDDLLVRQRWSASTTGLSLGFVAVIQFLLSAEILATSVVIGTVGLVWLAIRAPHGNGFRPRHVARGATLAIALFAPAVCYPLWYLLSGPGAIHTALYSPISNSADLLAFFVPGWHQAVTLEPVVRYATDLQGTSFEIGAYVDLPILLIAVASWRCRDRTSRWFLLMAMSCAVLILGPVLRVAGARTLIWLPGAIFTYVPVLRDLLPLRLSLYLDLFLAVVVARHIATLTLSPADRWRRVVTLLGVALWLPTVTAPVIAAPVPSYFTRSSRAGSTVLLLPFVQGTVTDLGMLWQASAHFRFAMPEGYYLHSVGPNRVTYVGPPYSPLTNALIDIYLGNRGPHVSPAWRTVARAYFAQRHVTAVVAGPGPHRARTVRFISSLLGQRPRSAGGVDVWRVSARALRIRP